MPLSMITKRVISDFKESDSNLSDETDESFPDKIFTLPVTIWKFAAEQVGPMEWHHTGKYYQVTYHYGLKNVAEYIANNYDLVQKEYHNYLRRVKNKKAQNQSKPVTLAVITVDVWGGTRKFPKIVDYDTVFGFLKRDWLVAYDASQSRYNMWSNRVEKTRIFTNLNAFKMYLGKDLDLRHFKKFLRQNNKHAYRYSNNKYDNVLPYNRLNHLDTIENPNDYLGHGLYRLFNYKCLDKEGNHWELPGLYRLLTKWDIMVYDQSEGYHLSSKFDNHTNYEILDIDYIYGRREYLYTPMFFNYLNKVMKKHGYKIPSY